MAQAAHAAQAAQHAKQAVSWSRTIEEWLNSLNQVLTSVGLMTPKDTSLVANVKDKEYCQKMVSARSDLESELIASGGEEVLLTKERKKVLSLSPNELLQKLKDGSMSAVLVLQSYQAMAIEETKKTNCITEFIPDAKKWAESLDAVKFGQMSDVQLPLHGLPLSVKDNILVEGMDSTLGLRKNVGQPAQSDAVVIQLLKKLGAIPFVRTNASQLCLTPGCSNPVWGETVHTMDPKRSPGGSSGGEGSLIAGGGSVLGLGTDIGGSVRLPSGWSGVVGLKPTARRISNKGVANVPGPVGIYGTVGLLGRDVPIVVEAAKAMFSADFNQYDVDIPTLPWRDAVYQGMSKKTLRIGYFDTLDVMPTTPGVRRAIAEAVASFKKLGHEVVPYTPDCIVEGVDIFMELMMADQGSLAYSMLKGETTDAGLAWYKQCAAVPPHVRQVAKPLIRRQFGDFATEHSLCSLSSIADLWKKMGDRDDYCNRFAQAWKKEELDLILCPFAASPAPIKEQIGKLTITVIYTLLFNLLDYPAANLPISRQNEDDEQKIEEYEAKDLVHELLKENGKDAVGLPLSVQLVALPYCEEVLCRALSELGKTSTYKL